MTKKKEVFPIRDFVADDEVSSDRVQVSFTLTGNLRGDVCSKDGLINEIDAALSDAAYNTNCDDSVKVESYSLKMTEFKNL